MAGQKFDTVIVFGPTGDVGGHAALEASKRGAKVWLAMRDPGKTIANIPPEAEKSGRFARVQADLLDAETVAKAIRESGAKAAYLYLVNGPREQRVRTLRAMKDAGIEYVVFLSSFSIEQGQDVRSVPEEEFIPYMHAATEVDLEEAGIPFTAVRPGHFASNGFKMNLDRSTSPPTAHIVDPDMAVDNIDPGDIGRVSGAVLVERPSGEKKEVIYLCGPQIIKPDEMWDTAQKVSGKKLNVQHLTPEEYAKKLVDKGTPPVIAQYLVKSLRKGTMARLYHPESMYKQAVANVEKYTGKKATTWAEYVEARKGDIDTKAAEGAGGSFRA